MGTPPIGEEQARERVEAIEQCLREGFSPKGLHVGKKGRGAIAEACLRIGAPIGSHTSWYNTAISTLGRDVDWSLYVRPEPEGRGGFDTDAPDGFNMKGRSTYYNADGNIVGEWVKTTRDQEQQEAMQIGRAHV